MQININEEYARKTIFDIRNRINNLISPDLLNEINQKIKNLEDSKQISDNKPIIPEKSALDEQLDMSNILFSKLLIKEDDNEILSQPWTRIDKISQKNLLDSFIKENIDAEYQVAYGKIANELLKNKLLTTQKHILYDRHTKKIIKIPCIVISEEGKIEHILEKKTKRVSKENKISKVETEQNLCVESDED